jgi:hypothetical protein
MRWAAAVVLGFMLAASEAEAGKAQQPPSRVTVTDLSGTAVPSFDGHLIVGSGLSVFGMVPRGMDATEPGLVLVEMLTSQTSSQVRRGSAKIDAMSFVYQLDRVTMRYRLANQVNYSRDGQPLYRVNLDNAFIEGPMSAYLESASGRTPPDGIESGAEFASIADFLAAADPILAPRRAALPPMTVTITPAPRRN